MNSETAIAVEVATHVDEALVGAVERLVPQLSSSTPPPSRVELEVIVAGPSTMLLLARSSRAVVGMLTLAIFRIPTGIRAWIEDVVVDTDARGAGRRRGAHARSRPDCRHAWRSNRGTHVASVP